MAAARETAQQKVARLEQENAQLRDAAAKASVGRRRFSARAFGAVVLVVIGTLLAPSALIVVWAKVQFTNTDNFVAMLAPLADDPEVQSLVVNKITTAIDSQIDIRGTTADLFDGLESLGLPPRATAALGLLEAPAAAGVASLIEGATTRVVESDAFATVWAQSLRTTHGALIAVLQGKQNEALVISENGQVDISLAPIIATVADRLEAKGLALGGLIPEVEVVLPIAQVGAIVQARIVYTLLDTLAWLLPLLSVLFLAGGILLARNRRRAGIRTAVVIAVVMAAVAIGVAIGRGIFIAIVFEFLPAGAAGAFFDAIVPLAVGWAITIAVLAVLAAIAITLAGPSEVAVRFRTAVAESSLIRKWSS